MWIRDRFEGWDKYDKAMEAYKYIDEIVAEGKENCLAAAKAWADKMCIRDSSMTVWLLLKRLEPM